MGDLLGQYTVMQENTWGNRKFYSAQDRRTGEAVYLIEEPAQAAVGAYDHPNLPHVHVHTTDGGMRWLIGRMPEGETLEDLRSRLALTEHDMLSALTSVLDGLAYLSSLNPPLVPGYLDPACIRRDQLGRWTVDYLALAHAPEARIAGGIPLGVHPFGVLLYWLITGQTARRTRVQVTRLQSGVPSALQFMVIRCLGRSYPSLAEIRKDIERAANDHEFRSLVQLINGPQRRRVQVRPVELMRPAEPVVTGTVLPEIPVVPEKEAPEPAPLLLEYRKVPRGGPYIPADDRPWALPPRPDDGFRKYVVPPPPNPLLVKLVWWGKVTTVSVAACFLAVATAIKAGVVPRAYLPIFGKKPHLERAYPGLARAGAQLGWEMPPQPVGLPVGGTGDGYWWTGLSYQEIEESLAHKQAGRRSAAPPDPESPGPSDPGRQPSGPAQPPAPPPPRTDPDPPQPVEPPEPEVPPLVPPEPGSIDYLDMVTGGVPVLVYVDGRPVGYAYAFLHPRHPYMSLGAFNNLFGRSVYWAPSEGGAVRLFTSDRSFFTRDVERVRERLWLKLTPELLQGLGVRMTSSSREGFQFETQR